MHANQDTHQDQNKEAEIPEGANVYAILVEDDEQRPRIMEQYFGPHAVLVEAAMFQWMSALCEDYAGGYWEMFTISTGGCFLVPPCTPDQVRVSVPSNGYEGRMSPRAAGIVALLFAISHQQAVLIQRSGMDEDTDRLSDSYAMLRHFAIGLPDAEEILSAID